MIPTPASLSPISVQTRRLGAALIALLLLATLVGVVALSQSGNPRRAIHQRPRLVHSARVTQSGAFGAALQFANGYLAFAYGSASGAEVSPVTPSLHNQLVRGRALVTPTERERQVAVRGLVLAPAAAGTEIAEARVDDGASPPYVFSFRLSLKDGGWIVDRVFGGDGGGSSP